MTRNFDVLVIGAGLAGSAVADLTAAAGLDVGLLDRRRPEQLGGNWFNLVNLPALLAVDGVLRPEGAELAAVRPAAQFIPTLDGEALPLDATRLVGLHVRPYVQRTLDRAVSRGAALLSGTRVTGLVVEGGRVVGADAGSARYRARVVVDASGCALSQDNDWLAHLGQPPLPDTDTVAAWQGGFRVRNPERVAAWQRGRLAPDVLVAFMAPYDAYSTLTLMHFPGRGEVHVLVGTKLGMAAVQERVEAIVLELDLDPRPVFGGGAIIPIRRPMGQLVRPGLLVIGDAGYLANPVGGSGTVTALLAASLAARTLATALREPGDPTLEALWPYAVAYQRGHGAVLASFDAVRRATERLGSGEPVTLFTSGLVSPQQIQRCLHEQPLRPRLRDLPDVLRGALLAPRLAAKLGPALPAVAALETLYRRYPATPEPRGLARWLRAVRGVDRGLEQALDRLA